MANSLGLSSFGLIESDPIYLKTIGQSPCSAVFTIIAKSRLLQGNCTFVSNPMADVLGKRIRQNCVGGVDVPAGYWFKCH